MVVEIEYGGVKHKVLTCQDIEETLTRARELYTMFIEWVGDCDARRNTKCLLFETIITLLEELLRQCTR